MGCLFEFLFEFIFEIVFDGIFYAYYWLMSLIVPSKTVSKKTERRIKTAVKVFCAFSMIFMFIGLMLMLASDGDKLLVLIGKLMLYIPLGITVLQVVLGIIAKIVTRNNTPKKSQIDGTDNSEE